MIEDDKKQKEKKHPRLLQKIKKQIMTQDIENIRISYSELVKKSKSGISKNTRYFFLYYKDKIGYINEIPKGIFLPFQTMANLPKLKQEIKLQDIKSAKSDKDGTIIIQFSNKDGKKQQWQLTASSPEMAKNWAKMIKNSLKQIKDDQKNPARQIIVDQKNDKSNKEKSQNGSVINSNQKTEKTIEKPNTNPLQSSTLPVTKNPQQLSPSNLNQKKQPLTKSEQKLLPQGQDRIKQTFSSQIDNQDRSIIPKFGQSPEKPQILKPISTLFVGGIAVQNEKDQTQLKNKMQTFENLTSKIKQQYQRKKQQQKRIQQQIKKQSEQQLSPMLIGKNLLYFSSDTKYQIQKMQRQWGYQFSKSQNQYEIVQKFRIYVEAVTRKIVDQLGLEQKKRYYQPQNTSSTGFVYEINGVQFQLFLSQLKEINSTGFNYSQKGTIVSNVAQKMAGHQFKNYDYILKLTKNKGKIRVPLSMMTHYKGFAIFAKVLIPSTQTYDKMDLLQKQLQILEVQSRINNSIFQDPDPDTGRIVALQSKAYQKLARAQSLTKKFDLCYIEDLKYYLPHDFNNFNKDRPYERLRWQLIQDEDYQDKVFYGQDMCAISSRLKLPQNLRDGINQLTDISKSIYSRIDILVKLLQSSDQYITNSKQISQIMHRNGINNRYLGSLLQKSKANWLKQILMSQIVARCAKKYLSFDLQDSTLNLNQSNIQNVIKFQQKQLIKFLNKMLGNTQQTDIFWKQLNRQSQSQYKVSINRQEINQQFLLQALQYHCCFKFKQLGIFNSDIGINGTGFGENFIEKSGEKNLGKNGGLLGMIKNASKIGIGITGNSPTKQSNKIKNNIQLFNSHSPFTIQNLACFQHRSKTYNLTFTQLYTTISKLLSSYSPQSFEQLNILLNLLRNQNLPKHLITSSIYQQLITYLINWIPPKKMITLYYPQQIQLGQILPSRLLYQIKLAQIRWALKQGNQQQSQKIKIWIVQHINKWIGQCHPILTQLYQIYANYYMTKKDEQKKSITYSKSAIKNQQKLISPFHHKIADSYYLLATIYRNYNKKLQAINTFKKSKQIILKTNNQQSQAYGQVCLKMGQLFLAVGEIQIAVNQGLEAIKVLQNYNNNAALVQAIQVVSRSYQMSEQWQKYLQFINKIVNNSIIQIKDDVELLQRLIKLIILPSLSLISKSPAASQKLLKLLSQLPDSTRNPTIAYNFVKVRIQDGSFPQRFLQYLADIEQILQEIENNGMIARWKGFQNLSNKTLLNKVGINMDNRGFYFIACLEAVNIFTAGSFIQGVLLA